MAAFLQMWDVFPEECFKKRDLESSRHAARRFYHRATGDNGADDVAENKGNLSTMLRGATQGSDQVLDWLVSQFLNT